MKTAEMQNAVETHGRNRSPLGVHGRESRACRGSGSGVWKAELKPARRKSHKGESILDRGTSIGEG